MKPVTITRDEAIALFEALGITTANKWNPKRMAAKLAKINEMVDTDTSLEGAVDETLTTVLEAIENGAEIIVGSTGTKKPEPEDEQEEAPKTNVGKKKAKQEPEEVEADEEVEPEQETDPFVELKARYDAGDIDAQEFAAERKKLLKGKKPKKDQDKPAPAPAQAPTKEKAAKEKAAKEKVASTTPGVRKNDTSRPFLAGRVLAKYGFEVGITDEMVAELDSMYKNTNERESRAALTYGWHVARGYAEGACD